MKSTCMHFCNKTHLPCDRILPLSSRNNFLLERKLAPPLKDFLSPLHRSPKHIACLSQNKAWGWPRGRKARSTSSLSYWHGVFKHFTSLSTKHTIFCFGSEIVQAIVHWKRSKLTAWRGFFVEEQSTPKLVSFRRSVRATFTSSQD